MQNVFQEEDVVISHDTFEKDILEGLLSTPKTLPSKYFYNERGDKLFHYIMSQPEYYLTCAEYEILNAHRSHILSKLMVGDGLRIIELGAGDGLKTRILLDAFLGQSIPLVYNPVDISPHVLNILCSSIGKDYPALICEPLVADYFRLEGNFADDGLRKMILFLGSNLGNFHPDEATLLLKKFSDVLSLGDYFLLGVDLVKDPRRILAAYNDASGVTAEFNYNLLHRINTELGANIKIENFLHYPVYNPLLQQAESYLVSKVKQSYSLAGQRIHFEAWEPVLTEISRKYTPENIMHLAFEAGFKVMGNYFDRNNDFCCSLWQKQTH